MTDGTQDYIKKNSHLQDFQTLGYNNIQKDEELN